MSFCCLSSKSKPEKVANLLDPIYIGGLQLKNRVILAPLTRGRCNVKTWLPDEMTVKYYE